MSILSAIPDIFIIILGFGFLIFVHELGHFMAAKWAGIRTLAFAIGMGPVMVSWRKGIGLSRGSTLPKYEMRVREHLARFASETESKPESKELDIGSLRVERAERELGLGETEYSLRWLPIGGFVRMLGQEDLRPIEEIQNPRSYSKCPIGKRMIVVSAGVIMNILLAFILFMIAFMAGVAFEAPIVGGVVPRSVAATSMPENADSLGITEPGLQPGDRIIAIDGDDVDTFADVQIAAAMGRSDRATVIEVEREGVAQPLRFVMTPELDEQSGLLTFGIAAAGSTQLRHRGREFAQVTEFLESEGLAEQGLAPGMAVTSVNREAVTTLEQIQESARRSMGHPLETVWQNLDRNGEPIGEHVAVELPVTAEFERLLYAQRSDDGIRDYEFGLLGMTPLASIEKIVKGSPNRDILRVGDVILEVGTVVGPKMAEVTREVRRHEGEELPMRVLRDGVMTDVVTTVSSRGMIGVQLAPAIETPMIAAPMTRTYELDADDPEKSEIVTTPVAEANLPALATILQVNDIRITGWTTLREALRETTAAARSMESDAEILLTFEHATKGHEVETIAINIPADNVRAIHELEWMCSIPGEYFESIFEERSAGGNPITAIQMGFAETHKLIVMTYLTIDRLFRGSVGVEQLRGPVGIVDLGSKILPRGFMFFLFFLGMISVNLAVINFLPLPIVDGGLFLFLVYEKLKGKPPSVAFQNAATIVGLVLIGAIFLVTFYNDIARLVG